MAYALAIDKLFFGWKWTYQYLQRVYCITAASHNLVELWQQFEPSSKIFLLTIPRRCFFCGLFMLFYVLFSYAFMNVCLLMPCGHLLGKGWPLGFRLWCLNCDVVTFPLVSWVRCGAWLYRFLIFASFLLCGKMANFG